MPTQFRFQVRCRRQGASRIRLPAICDARRLCFAARYVALERGTRHDLDFGQRMGPDLFSSGYPAHASVGIRSGVRYGG
jgi:hypothetical protein